MSPWAHACKHTHEKPERKYQTEERNVGTRAGSSRMTQSIHVHGFYSLFFPQKIIGGFLCLGENTTMNMHWRRSYAPTGQELWVSICLLCRYPRFHMHKRVRNILPDKLWFPQKGWVTSAEFTFNVTIQVTGLACILSRMEVAPWRRSV